MRTMPTLGTKDLLEGQGSDFEPSDHLGNITCANDMSEQKVITHTEAVPESRRSVWTERQVYGLDEYANGASNQ